MMQRQIGINKSAWESMSPEEKIESLMFFMHKLDLITWNEECEEKKETTDGN